MGLQAAKGLLSAGEPSDPLLSILSTGGDRGAGTGRAEVSKDDVDVSDDAGESVQHGQCSHLVLGHAAVLSRRKLGGCALFILRQPTSDAGGHSATIIVNHLAKSPPPTVTATATVNQCILHRGLWVECGGRQTRW